MNKYQFKIRTRGGMLVDHISIAGRDQTDAERKLFQIYHDCAVLDVQQSDLHTRPESTDIDSIISLISRQDRD